MKRLRSRFLAILLLGVLSSPAWAEDGRDHQDGRRHTGATTLASGRAADGQADPRVSVTPSGGSSQAAVVCATDNPAWASPLAGSKWISLQADCTAALANATNYGYSTSFRLPANHSDARIAGEVLADDSVTIQLNGNTIFTGGGFTTASTFSSSNASFFVTGVNTLTFTVNNVTNASGLDYVARIHGVRNAKAR